MGNGTEPINSTTYQPTAYHTTNDEADTSNPAAPWSTTYEPKNDASLSPNWIKKIGRFCLDGYHEAIDPRYCTICPDNTAGKRGVCRECLPGQEPNFHHDDCEDKEEPEKWYDNPLSMELFLLICAAVLGI